MPMIKDVPSIVLFFLSIRHQKGGRDRDWGIREAVSQSLPTLGEDS